MQHLASATVVAGLVIEVPTDLALSLGLVLAFSLAFVLAFRFALALICLRFLLDILCFVDDVLLVAGRTPQAVRTPFSIAEVKA